MAAAECAVTAIVKAVELLGVSAFSCRKIAGQTGSPFLREPIILFEDSGYLALF